MNFVGSSPRNGATGVSQNPRIRTTFSLNVAAELAHNRTQIRLFRGTSSVGIRVTASSVFSDRRNLFITPTSNLMSDTDYRLVLLPGLRANNGNTLGETVTIRFRTGRVRRRRPRPRPQIPQE
ncbi:MAG: Ig-like domain-containing protein [Syntrophomonadaceae bacterium]|nr:Ig-like domain-containing protein [Syntrophomonadaceae bacterium]